MNETTKNATTTDQIENPDGAILDIPTTPKADCKHTLRIAWTIYRGTQLYHRFGLGVVPAGESGRKVYQGDLIPGPWSFAFPLAVCIDSEGKGTKRDSDQAIAAGTEHTVAIGGLVRIDGVVYRIDPDHNDNIELVAIDARDIIIANQTDQAERDAQVDWDEPWDDDESPAKPMGKLSDAVDAFGDSCDAARAERNADAQAAERLDEVKKHAAKAKRDATATAVIAFDAGGDKAATTPHPVYMRIKNLAVLATMESAQADQAFERFENADGGFALDNLEKTAAGSAAEAARLRHKAEQLIDQGEAITPAELAEKIANESYYAFNMAITLSEETALFRAQLADFIERCIPRRTRNA